MSDQPKEDRLLDHDYDGIREYDNPMPRWWLWIFYACIAWSVVYYLNIIPGVGSGKGRIADFERESAAATALAAAADSSAAATAPLLDDATVLAAAHDPRQLALGRTTFTNTCVACHLADGGGSIGPNLTDEYWLHGAHPSDIAHTITNGVADKGMPPWGSVLKPEEVLAVAGYVTTLRGTHPATPKEPQGIKVDDDDESKKH